MDRRRFVSNSLITGAAASLGAAGLWDLTRTSSAEPGPRSGPVKVAFVIGDSFNVIDTSGPWEVFQDAMRHDEHEAELSSLFELFVVSGTVRPVTGTGGLVVIPHYSFANAPTAQVVLIPAQRASPGLHEWLRTTAKTADLLMSVCTGAFQLAATGLLDGLAATTHHDFYDAFERKYPKVRLQRGLRYVEHPKLATAGGLTSGIDLALRVVERYYGRAVAQSTAKYMEYQGAQYS